MRRATLFALLLLGMLAIARDPARADLEHRPPGSAIQSLPPGAWFRAGYLQHAFEREPQTPRFAAIAGSFSDAASAERAARAIDRTRVSLGYPWVVANHDLRIERRCDESIVVVAGLFASRADARAWRAQDRSRARLSVVAVESAETARPCGWSDASTDGGRSARHLEITHIDPSADALAYDGDAMTTIFMAFSDPDVRIAALPPVCTVPRGSVHAFDVPRLAYAHGYGYAPARCGDRIVYVRVDRTLRDATVEHGDDGARLRQITNVECDTSHIDAWHYSLDGRAEIPGEAPTYACDCGD